MLKLQSYRAQIWHVKIIINILCQSDFLFLFGNVVNEAEVDSNQWDLIHYICTNTCFMLFFNSNLSFKWKGKVISLFLFPKQIPWSSSFSNLTNSFSIQQPGHFNPQLLSCGEGRKSSLHQFPKFKTRAWENIFVLNKKFKMWKSALHIII